jgi:hypothetical protein
MQALRYRRVSSASKSLGAPGSHLHPPRLRSKLCGSTKELRRFCGELPQTPRTRCSLRTNPTHDLAATSSRLDLGFEAQPKNCTRFFLPQCGPHLISFGHRVHRAEPTCLSTPHRPHKLRLFALALHLHQCKSSRNLHLQYSAKSQSTSRCQSLITPRSDHPPVLGRSDPRTCGRKATRLPFSLDRRGSLI